MNKKINLVLFVGGKGTRINSGKNRIPKGLSMVGEKPLLWYVIGALIHNSKLDIILCTGFLQNKYTQYFKSNYKKLSIDDNLKIFSVTKYKFSSKVNIYLLPTGENSTIVERFFQANKFLDFKTKLDSGEKVRIFSYGDTVMDINIPRLIMSHKKNKNLVTASSYVANYEYGLFEIQKKIIKNFYEKHFPDSFRVNSGFFVMEPTSIKLLSKKANNIDGKFFKRIIKLNKLGNFPHKGFWFPIDSAKNLREFENLINEKKVEIKSDNL